MVYARDNYSTCQIQSIFQWDMKILLHLLCNFSRLYQINMTYFSLELPPPLSLIAIFAIIIVYMVICYLVLDLIDQQQGDPNDDVALIDVVHDSGLSVEELQEINCFYIKGQVNYSICAICLDGLVDTQLCRSFPACNHMFHAQCIDPWLAKKPTCPTCRTPFRPRCSFLK